MTQSVFDAHLRIIDPAHPLLENNGYLPDAFTVADYRHRIARLGMHADGLPQLLRLVEQGVKVKATSFGRVDLDARPPSVRAHGLRAHPGGRGSGAARRHFLEQRRPLLSRGGVSPGRASGRVPTRGDPPHRAAYSAPLSTGCRSRVRSFSGAVLLKSPK